MEFWRRKNDKEEARECFLKNGSKYLQKLIADSNGKSNPIQMFSSHQISKATNHFDPKCSLPGKSRSLHMVQGRHRRQILRDQEIHKSMAWRRDSLQRYCLVCSGK
ncbi:unnamed protein product [Brassica rapa subsp. trilocularis]